MLFNLILVITIRRNCCNHLFKDEAVDSLRVRELKCGRFKVSSLDSQLRPFLMSLQLLHTCERMDRWVDAQ